MASNDFSYPDSDANSGVKFCMPVVTSACRYRASLVRFYPMGLR